MAEKLRLQPGQVFSGISEPSFGNFSSFQPKIQKANLYEVINVVIVAGCLISMWDLHVASSYNQNLAQKLHSGMFRLSLGKAELFMLSS